MIDDDDESKKWVDDWIEEKRADLAAMSEEGREHILKLTREMYKGFDLNPGDNHVRAAPVLDIYSVVLNPSDQSLVGGDNTKPWEIYGVVQVTNGVGNTYDLYNYEMEDPDVFDMDMCGGPLSITLFDIEPVIQPYPNTSLQIHLWDKVRGLELANGTFNLDFAQKNDFEEVSGVGHVGGKDGTAAIHYHFYPAAVYGRVDVTVFRRKHSDDCLDDTIDVYGSVVALCGTDHGFEGGSYRIELFNEQADDPVKAVKFGDPIELQRSFIVVPAYSSLRVEAKLRDCDERLVTLPAQDFGPNHLGAMISDTVGFSVSVFWYPAYLDGIIPERKCPREEASSPQTKKSKLDLQVFMCETPTSFQSGPAMEVFSAYVVCNHDQPLKLFGRIDVVSDDGCLIFKRERSEAISLFDNKQSLKIMGPHHSCIGGNNPYIKVKLMDDQNRQVCKGFIALNWMKLENSHSISYYDRRVCAIIGGEQGFAALHYTVFSHAVEAVVKVLLSASDSSIQCIQATYVSGIIVAQYSNYVYETPSEKERYISILFSEDSERRLELSENEMIQLPLSKSVLPVPETSTLIIDFSLLARPELVNSGGHLLKGIAEFEIGTRSHWMIYGDGCFADVSIEWRSHY